mmetsp:Transcript_104496/g.207560  ORF Transcript_104496/g.207560 Transcript_104496/m.207560 type:complete len:88 (-) Transcript_104496:94-357(-)
MAQVSMQAAGAAKPQVDDEVLEPDLGDHTPRKESRRQSKRQQEIDVSVQKNKRRHSKAEAEPPIAGCLQVTEPDPKLMAAIRGMLFA